MEKVNHVVVGEKSYFSDAISAVAITIVSVVVVSIGVASATVAIGAPTDDADALTQVTTIIVQSIIFILTGFAVVSRRSLRIREYIGIATPTRSRTELAIGVGIGAGILLFAGGSALQAIIRNYTDHQVQATTNPVVDIVQTAPVQLPVFILLMIVFVGVSEELLFRGVIQSRLREDGSVLFAISVTTLLFLAVHLPGYGSESTLVGIGINLWVLTLFSVLLGLLYEYTDNIFVPALTHGTYNSMTLVLAVLV